MTITEKFQNKRCVFSIECFPPKQTTQMDKMKATLQAMRALNPDFISVTFGAGGSAGGVSTVEVADYIQHEVGVPALAHLICMGNDQTSAARILDELEQAGVRDVLALRGDRTPTRPESPDFKHASDLTAFIKWKKPGFSVHGACYPEAHPEAAILQQDVENLRIKQANGAEHLLTQLFFDNMHFYRFLNLARRAGVTLPVLCLSSNAARSSAPSLFPPPACPRSSPAWSPVFRMTRILSMRPALSTPSTSCAT